MATLSPELWCVSYAKAVSRMRRRLVVCAAPHRQSHLIGQLVFSMKMDILNIFPEGLHPKCWSDDVRMKALFAPFRPKAANPESWETKVGFWSDMLRRWCRLRRDPVLSANEARLAFQRKGRTPDCIEIVVEECLKRGDLSPISKYLHILHKGSKSWRRWNARSVFKSAGLAVSRFVPFKRTIDQDRLPKASIDSNERFVVESVLKEQATRLLSDYPSNFERFGTIEELMTNTKFNDIQRETFEVLLGYLISEGQATKKGKIIKLASPRRKASPVKKSDVTMHGLLASERKLTAEAEKFAKKAERALEEARVAIYRRNRLTAKNHLRRKHRYQQKIVSTEKALKNVHRLMHTMKKNELNAAVLDACRTIEQAMNRTREVYGPKANTARDHVAEMEKILGMQNEVDEMLFNSVDDSNTEELEEELNGLMLEPISPSSGGDNDKNKEVKGEFMAGPSQKASPVKKPDVTMRRLLSLERKLTAQAEKFTEKAERTLEQARVAIKRRNRVVAINHLRRRRFYLKKVTSSVKVLENVKHLKYRLMQNEVDAAAVDVCSSKPSGSSTTFHKAPGGERYKDARSSWPDFDSSADSDIEDLERRLRNLRGLNS